jgi:RNA polymerase sigma-70 factor, ECF subfamily
MEMSDLEAVARTRAGDTDAFRVLVERYSRSLFGLAWRLTGNRQDAEDVVQESFLRGFRQLHRFDERAQFGTWLYRIAANYALDVVRGRKRQGSEAWEDGDGPGCAASLPAPDPAPDRLAFGGEVRRRVAGALEELSPAERSAFVLRHFEGMRVDEIATTLGVDNGAARHSIFRAVRKLRRALAPVMAAVN